MFISNLKPHRSTRAKSHVYAALGRDLLVQSTDHTQDTAVVWTGVDVTRPPHMGHNYIISVSAYGTRLCINSISAYGTRLNHIYLCIWDTALSYPQHLMRVSKISRPFLENQILFS